MSCFLSEEVRIQRRINKEIDRQLLRDKKDMKRELKLLLLGKTRYQKIDDIINRDSACLDLFNVKLCFHCATASHSLSLSSGTGESGKSTFIKQMRIIHGSGYSDTDRRQFTNMVFRNIFTSVQALVSAMEHLQIKYENPNSQTAANKLSSIYVDGLQDISDEDKEFVKTIWADPGVQLCYERRREFQLSDSTK